MPYFSNENIITIDLESSTERLYLISAYMAQDDEVKPPPMLREALAEARRSKTGVIIGINANSVQKKIRNAKRDSWKKFCNGHESMRF